MVPAWGGSRLAACLAKIMLSPYFRTAWRSTADRILYGCAARQRHAQRAKPSRLRYPAPLHPPLEKNMSQTANEFPTLNDAALLRSQAYLNGEWVGAATSFEVRNPADGAIVGSAPNMGAAEAQQAIDAAAAAFPAWAAKTGKERAKIMRKWFDLMIAHADDLATLTWPPLG